MSDLIVKCRRCGHLIPTTYLQEQLTPELAATAASWMVCESCSRIVAAESEQDKREAEKRELQARLDERYAERIADSQLDTYGMTYDPNWPTANRDLMRWMLDHLDASVWIVGESGRCKTRCIQSAARLACRDRSIRYWPVLDLAARLTETSKHPESQLRDIYFAELLILDDLGKEHLTAARLASIGAIVDRRYIGWDQIRRSQGTDHPRFGMGTTGGRLGGQLWITSQLEPDALAERLSSVNQSDATAIVRRLAEMCTLHRV